MAICAVYSNIKLAASFAQQTQPARPISYLGIRVPFIHICITNLDIFHYNTFFFTNARFAKYHKSLIVNDGLLNFIMSQFCTTTFTWANIFFNHNNFCYGKLSTKIK